MGRLGFALLIALTVAAAASDSRPVEATGLPTLRTDDRLEFADLGWTSDVTLRSESPDATAQFHLPEGSRQGETAWYGLRLNYHWEGLLPVGRPVYLYAYWNDDPVYQLKVIRRDTLGFSAVEWSIVDNVWGGGGGVELTSSFDAASSNFAAFRAVRPGRNTLALRLDTRFAPGADPVVTLSRKSSVFATSWQPTTLDVTGRASVSEGAVQLDVRVRNHGLPAPRLDARLLVSYANGSKEVLTVGARGPVAPRERVDFRQDLPIGQVDVASVHLLLSWGTGQGPYRVWPAASDEWWMPSIPVWSLGGALVALLLAWIAFPAAARSLCQESR